MSSIFDKAPGKELLSAPIRLAIKTDNPQNWPAWNMDYDQEIAPPRAYVGGEAKIRVVENGPARVALEVTRETEGYAIRANDPPGGGPGGRARGVFQCD